MTLKTPPKMPAPAPSSASLPPKQNTASAIQETLELMVIAFIFAFVFRAYVVEAFVIPTGSMAPTLLGQHLPVTCKQCGYRFKTDVPEHSMARTVNGTSGVAIALNRRYDAICPMCKYHNILPKGTRPRHGDRILVHKYIYSINAPRRWDVVVFKNPNHPSDNYIKRLVGLPGESICLIEGNIYVKPKNASDDQWQIARKTDLKANRQAGRIQRAMWQPIYHSQYAPLDDGKTPGGQLRWQRPWAFQGNWQEVPAQRRYTLNTAEPGSITFDFNKQVQKDVWWYPYNQSGYENPSVLPPNPLLARRAVQDITKQPIEDVRLAATVVPAQKGLSIKLQTTARLDQNTLDAKRIILVAHLDATGKLTLGSVGKHPIAAADRPLRPTTGETPVLPEVFPQSLGSDPAPGNPGNPGNPETHKAPGETPDHPSRSSAQRILAATQVQPMPAHKPTRVELWYVDRCAIVFINGKRALQWTFPVADFDVLLNRKPLDFDDYPDVKIQLAGSAATLYHVELDRDVAYTTRTSNIKRAARQKMFDGTMFGGPLEILDDQYFCMGDNSPNSSDGRMWQEFALDPLVEQTLLAGDKYDGHRYGIVPRKLMIGRAFFVYFPSPYPAFKNGMGLFPNFGDMRMIH